MAVNEGASTSNQSQNRGLLLPGHNYIGPGNSMPNGPPIDIDDAIAMQHDIEYEKAESADDIRRMRELIYQADVKAIFDFYKEWKDNYNWHALIGSAGLTLKAGFELLLGRPLHPTELKRQPNSVAQYHYDMYKNNDNYLDPRNVRKYKKNVENRMFHKNKNNNLHNYYNSNKRLKGETPIIKQTKKPQTMIYRSPDKTVKQWIYLKKYKKYEYKKHHYHLRISTIKSNNDRNYRSFISQHYKPNNKIKYIRTIILKDKRKKKRKRYGHAWSQTIKN